MRGGVGLRRDQVPNAGNQVLAAHHRRADRGVALGRAAARLLYRGLRDRWCAFAITGFVRCFVVVSCRRAPVVTRI